MEWHCYTATLAVMTNVRGTGWDWPRNKFSLPSGARGRRKHTRLPKIKDRDHFQATSATTRPENATRDLCAGATSTSPGRIMGQLSETRTPRSSSIVIANPNNRKSSAAKKDRETFEKEQHGDRPRENSTNNIIQRTPHHTTCKYIYETVGKTLIKISFCLTGCTHSIEKYLDTSSQVLATLSVVDSSLIAHHKYFPKITRTKGAQNLALMKIPGCSKTKGAVRKGDIFIIIVLSKKKEIGAREKRVLATKNKLQNDS
jgi:hypothetical protein